MYIDETQVYDIYEKIRTTQFFLAHNNVSYNRLMLLA